MGATPAVLDMTYAELKPNGKPMIDSLGRPPEKQGGRPATSMSRKQIRARARRKMKIGQEELATLYKPIDEWDAEELARGRPRAKDGTFKGKPPQFIDRALHEQIVRKFETVVRTEMNTHTVKALEVIDAILTDDSVDDRGKPVVPAGTKLEASKFLIEHILGKPKQRVESDISVKLQGLLGTAIVNPVGGNPSQGFELTAGYVDAESWEEDDDYESDSDG